MPVTRRRTLGVLSPYVGGDYYGAIIAGLAGAATAGGDRIVAVQTLDPGSFSADRAGVPTFARPVAWRHLDALAVLPGAVPAGYAEAARLSGRPVVFVGQDGSGTGCSSVVVDNRSGVRAAVAHLIDHGHQRIAFVGHLIPFDLRERYEGYLEGLTEAGIGADRDLVFTVGDNEERGGESGARALIEAGLPATAVITGTDRNAIGLMRWLQQEGHRVPDRVAVIGFDDIPDAEFSRPGLSTVRQPLDRTGAAAHRILDRLLAGEEPGPLTEQVPTMFLPRGSCGCDRSGLSDPESRARSLFDQVRHLQASLSTQHELGVRLLDVNDHDPRTLDWLAATPAIGGSLGLWPDDGRPESGDDDPVIEIVGWVGPGSLGTDPDPVPVSGFPPEWLLTLADRTPDHAVFVVPVRSPSRDWGVLAAVGRIQASTPPGREMMNQSGALLAAALDHRALVVSLRDREETLRNAALHDHLTGLANRTLLEDRLNRAHLRSVRRPGRRYAVLVLDLDGFKSVNDSHGHGAGDLLLIEVGRRLGGLVRNSDTVARIGGDEFVILLDDITGDTWRRSICDAITDAVTAPFDIDGHRVEVGVSIGIAESDERSDPSYLLREADIAMYRQKAAGRRR